MEGDPTATRQSSPRNALNTTWRCKSSCRTSSRSMRGTASIASFKVSSRPLFLSRKLTSLPSEHPPLSYEWHTIPNQTTNSHPATRLWRWQCHTVFGGSRRSLAVLGAHSIAGIAVTIGKQIGSIVSKSSNISPWSSPRWPGGQSTLPFWRWRSPRFPQYQCRLKIDSIFQRWLRYCMAIHQLLIHIRKILTLVLV